MADKTVYNHYVFRTYKGESSLIDKESIQFLYESFEKIATVKGFQLITCKILADHVHCLIGFNEKHRPDYVIKMMKGISSRYFFEKFRTNRFVYRKLWGRSYFCEELNENNIQTVINYINNQSDEKGFDKRFSRKN